MAVESITCCPICAGIQFKSIFKCIDKTVSNEKFSIILCETCSFTITSPRPDILSISPYYNSENYISHAASSTSIVDKIYFKARQYSLVKKRKLIQRYSNGGELLDIGCGTGEFLKHMNKYGWNVEGTEPSHQALSLATKNGIRIHSDYNELTNQQFQTITLWHVLEHIHQLHEVIQKIKSLIDSSGTIFIAVPNHKSYDAKYYQEHWAAYDVPRHLWHFNQVSMNLLLKKHDLKIIETVPMKLDSYYVSLLSEGYKNQSQFKFVSLIKAFLQDSNRIWKQRKLPNIQA